MAKIIKINKGYVDSGLLDLKIAGRPGSPDHGASHVQLSPGTSVRWKIMPQSDVDRIISITAKPDYNANLIFSDLPHEDQSAGHEGEWVATVKTEREIPELTLFDYIITWEKDTSGGTLRRECDPLLSINPTKKVTGGNKWFDENLVNPILGLIGILLSSLILRRMAGMKKRLSQRIDKLDPPKGTDNV